MATKKTKKCSSKGCRKRAAQNGMCDLHAHNASYPVDAIEKMTDIEALSFKAMDAELRNNLQGIKLLDYELDSLRRKYQEEANSRMNQKKQLESLFTGKKQEYDNLVREIAEKRGLDPMKLTLDPDTKAIRDLRNES